MSVTFNDAPEYKPLHYELVDIRDLIKDMPTSEKIDDIDPFVMNITINLVVQTAKNNIAIKDLAVMKRIRSP